jgi:hypothetical protein
VGPAGSCCNFASVRVQLSARQQAVTVTQSEGAPLC